MSIQKNLRQLKSEIGDAATLIAVTKYSSEEEILEAYQAGHRHFGENKVQDLEKKWAALPKDIFWHFIGHLQRNKVKYIAEFIHMIHAVDSLRLLQKINSEAQKENRVIRCLLQMHIAKESSKFGMDEHQILAMLQDKNLEELKFVQLCGLMGMATHTNDSETVTSEFGNIHKLQQKLRSTPLPANVSMDELSIGMSDDYQLALLQGGTMLRIGSRIFKN